MSAPNTNVKVGLFVIIGFTLILGGIITLGAGQVFRQTIPAETYIDESVQGLDVGSAVKQRGVQIGKVSRIDFVRNQYPLDPKDPNYAVQSRLVMVQLDLRPSTFRGVSEGEIDDTLNRVAESGLRIRLASQGFTGTAYLEVDFIANPVPPPPLSWTPRSHYIPSAPSTISRLTSSAETVVRNIERTDIAKLVTQATALIDDLRQTNANVQKLVDGGSLQTMREDMQATVHDARQIVSAAAENVVPAMAELRRASAELATTASTLNQSLSGGEIKNILANTDGVTADLHKLTSSLPEILATVDQSLRRLDGILISGQGDLSVTLGNLEAATRNLRDLSENAKRYPSQLLFGSPPPPESAFGAPTK